MGTVACPAEGCDYSGSVSSVEGHISGSTNGWHSGKHGRRYREMLESREENVDEQTTPVEEADDSTGEESSEEAEESDAEPPEVLESDRADVPTSGASAAGAAGVGALGLLSSDKVPTVWIILGVVVLAALLLATAGEPVEEGEADVADTEEATQSVEQSGGGLRGD